MDLLWILVRGTATVGVDLRIFQRNGLKLDKDLILSGLVQNVYAYQMAKSKKI